MRKNSVRKWLHAILDLLPLFVIPIFAIYTRNENYNSNIEVQVYENKVVDFNQLRKNDGGNTNIGCITTITESVIHMEGTATVSTTYSFKVSNVYTIANHIYAFRIQNLTATPRLLVACYFNRGSGSSAYLSYQSVDTLDTIKRYQASTDDCSFELGFTTTINTIYDTTFNYNIFDLTQMFGSGNEPTNEDFITYLNQTNYPYIESEEIVIENYQTITYNDTDVGSQFVYTLYNATDKYFNCTNLFNLEQVWNWVQLNLFGGNAPLMVYVVWQVIVYEFFMDLIFLLYSVFMFIIDFAENCLERPFDKIRRL